MEQIPSKENQLSDEELASKMEDVGLRYRNHRRTGEDPEIILKEAQELAAVRISRCITYEDFVEANYAVLHPDDKKATYLKLIATVQNQEYAQQLVYHAPDNETRVIAEKRLAEFK